MRFWFRLLAAVAMLGAVSTGLVLAQSGHPMDHTAMNTGATVPKLPGQDAFGAIQEIVEMLNADPKTDWSKVDLEALRQHLIDMNEVTLKADASPKPIDGGLEDQPSPATAGHSQRSSGWSPPGQRR